MTTDALGPALHALARIHRARLTALLAPHGIHVGQDVLLLALWEEPGLSQAALAIRLGVEPPTITRMLQRLERSGLVERRADPHDARILRVHPTSRSRLLEGTVRRAWAQLEEVLVAELGEEAAARLRELARAGASALQADDARSVG